MKGYTEIDGKIYISSSRAHEISGYSKDYIGQLSRAKKIEARMIGRSWYINEDSLLKHKKEAEALAEIRNQEYAAQSARAKLTLDAPKEPVQVYDARQMLEAVSAVAPIVEPVSAAIPAESAVLVTPAAPVTASIPPISWNISYSADERPLLPTLQKKVAATGPTSPVALSPLAPVKSPFMKDLHQIAATAAMITVLGIGAVYAMHPDMVTASLAAAARQIVATAVGLTHSTEEATVAARSQFSGARVTLATASVGDLFKYIFGSDGSSTNSGNSGYINRGAPLTDMERYPYYIGGLTTSNFATTPENVIYPGITGTSTAASAAATASAGSTKTGTRVAAATSSLKSQMSLADIDAHIEEVLSRFVPWRPTYTFISGQSINDATLTGAAIGPSINAAITGGTTAFNGASLTVSGQATVGSINVSGGIASGGPVNISSGINLLLSTDSSGNVVATTSPTVAAIFATSTTATSTFAGAIQVGNAVIFTPATDSVFIGNGAGLNVGPTGGSTAVGYQALASVTTGWNNTAIGALSGTALTTGDHNTFVGRNSGAAVTSGDSNVFVGNLAGGTLCATCSGDVYIGRRAGNSASSTNSVLIGNDAGVHLTGDNNIVFGGGTLDSNNYVGGNNIFIGSNIEYPSTNVEGMLDIGNLIFGTNLGPQGTALATGTIGIGTTTPSATFAVQGSGLFSGDISAANIIATGTISVPSFVLNGASPNTVLATDANGHVVSTSTLTANNFWATSSSAVNYFAGNIGVGTTSPSANLAVQGAAYVSGNLTVGGNTITLGNSTSNTLTINSAITSDIIPNQNNTYKLGSPSFYWQDLYINNVHANNISAASTTIGGTTDNNFIINSDNASADAESATLVFNRGTVVPNAVITWDATNKQFNFNQSTLIQNASANQLSLPTLTLKGQASQTGDIFQVASSSGAYVLNVTADGRVGIGSTSPSQLLGVQGNALFSGNISAANLTATGTVQAAGSIVSNSGYVQSVSGIFRGDDQYHQIIFHNGTNSTDYIEWGDTLANGGGHRFYTGGASPTLRMEIADNGTYMQGPVGIGTTSPSQALSIQGNGLFSGDLSAANVTATGTLTVNNLTVSGGTSYTGLGTTTFAGDILARGISAWQYLNAPFIQATSTTATSTFAGGLNVGGTLGLTVQQGSGWVGIGTTSPADTLDVVGNIRTAGTGDARIYSQSNGAAGGRAGLTAQFDNSTNGGFHLLSPVSTAASHVPTAAAFDTYLSTRNAGNSLLFAVNNVEKMRIDGTTGNVGIGTTTPGSLLTVNGSISASTTLTFLNTGSAASPDLQFPGGLGIYVDSGVLDISPGRFVAGGSAPSFDFWGGQHLATRSDTPIGWASGTNLFANAIDTAFSRLSAGKVSLGNGTQGDTSGTLIAATIGVGTTSPAATLGVQGNALISGNITSVANITATGTLTVAGNATFGGTSLAGNDASGSFDFFANRNDTSHSATYGYKTAGTLNWYNGLRGLANNNWYLYNNNTGMNTITADYNTDLVTINSSLTAGNTITASNFVGTSSANSTFAGKVGIGTTSPFAKLSVYGSANPAVPEFLVSGSGNYLNNALMAQFNFDNDVRNVRIRQSGLTAIIDSNGATALAIGPNDTGDVYLQTGATDRLHVTSAGNVGIGTTSPTGAKLVVQGQQIIDDTSEPYLLLKNNSTNVAAFDALSSKLNIIGYSGYGIDFYTNGNNPTNRVMSITTGGNVGIGTTSPTTKLYVSNTNNNQLQLDGTGTYTAAYWSNSNVIKGEVTWANDTPRFLVGTDVSAPLVLETNASERMRIDSSGNVGIGTTSPTVKFSVGGAAGDTSGHAYFTGGLGVGLVNTTAGTIQSSGAITANGNLNTAGDIALTNAGAATIRETGGGYLVVGTTANNVYLDPASQLFIRPAGGHTAMTVSSGASVVNYIDVLGANTGLGPTISAQTTGSDTNIPINISGKGTGAIVLNGSGTGNVGIGTTTPQSKLVVDNDGSGVVSSVDISPASAQNRRLILTEQRITATRPSGGTSDVFMQFDPVNGYLGVDKAAPQAALHVYGSGTSGQVSSSFILENGNSGSLGLDITGAAGASGARWLYAGGPGTGTNSMTPFMYMKLEGSTAGYVGIGNTAPSALLTVGNTALPTLAGNSAVISGVDVYSGTSIPTTAPQYGNLVLFDTTSGAQDVGSLLTFSGYSDAGTTKVNYAGVRGAKENGTSGNAKGYLGFYTEDNVVGLAERMRISSGGSVGIGTTSPASTLSVSGNSYITNNEGIGVANPSVHLQVAGTETITASDGLISGLNGLHMDFTSGHGRIIAIQQGTSYRDLYLDGSNIIMQTAGSGGNVGIGNTAPANKLTVAVAGNATLNTPGAYMSVFNSNDAVNNQYYGIAFTNSNTPEGGTQQPQSLISNISEGGSWTTNWTGNLVFSTARGGTHAAPQEAMRITSAGNVGIGTSSPSQALSVQGNGLFSGNISAANITATGTATVGGLTIPANTWMTSNTPTNILRDSFFGYSSSYRVVQLGLNSSTRAISLGADLTSNTSNQFSGNEIVIPNNVGVIAPNAANNSYLGVLGVDSNNKIQIGKSNFALFTSGGYMTIDTSGGAQNGNVGIGTTSPASLFSVGGNAIQSQGLYVDSNGVLGIGDSNPSATAQRLHISGSATQSTGSVSGTVIDTSLTSTKAASTAWILGLDVKGTYNTSVTSGNNLSMMAALRVGSGATIANLSNGTITTAAGADFEAPTLTAGSGVINKGATVYIAGAPSGANNNFALYSSSGTNYFGGNVGIGTTTPWAQLSVNPNGVLGPEFAIGSSTKTDFMVANNGYVGIGTTSPYGNLSVKMGDTASSAGLVLANSGGVELITNSNDRDFSSADNWSGTNWAVTGGVLQHTSGSGLAVTLPNSAMTSGQIIAGRMYAVTFTVTGMTTGLIRPLFTSGVNATFSSANGTYTNYITTSVNNDSLTFKPSSSFDGAIDNVSVQLVPSLFVVNGLGNLGIGTSTPTSNISVTGGSSSSNVLLGLANSSNVNQFMVRGDGLGYLSSRLAIGTTSDCGCEPLRVQSFLATSRTALDSTGMNGYTEVAYNTGGIQRWEAGINGSVSGQFNQANFLNGYYVYQTADVNGNGVGKNRFMITDNGYTAIGPGIGGSIPYSGLSVIGDGTGNTGQLFSLVDSASTTLMQVLNNGNVGIGTVNPLTNLHVAAANSGGVGASLLVQNSAAKALNNASQIIFGSSNDFTANTYAGRIQSIMSNVTNEASDLTFSTYNGATDNEWLRITGSGNIGIGITNPSDRLVVRGFNSNAGMEFGNSSLGINYIQSYDRVAAAYRPIQIQTGSTPSVYLDTAGNVGIGTTSPATTLDVALAGGMARFGGAFGNNLIQTYTNGGVSGIGLWAGGGNNMLYTTGNLSFGTNATIGTSIPSGQTTAMTILTNGNVGIGTTTPYAKLSVVGGSVSAQTTDATFSTGPLAGDLRLDLMHDAGRSIIELQSVDNSGNSQKLSLNPNGGNVGIGTTSPYAALSVAGATGVVANQFYATSTTATSTFAGGLDVGNGALRYDFTSGATSISNLELGNMTFDADSGVVNWADMPVTSASAAGTIESYTAALNGNPMITVFGKSDGAGGVTNLGVGIGTTSPISMLSVQGALPYISLKSTSSNAGTFQLISDTSGGSKYFSIYDYDNAQHRLFINNAGNVGIGTTSPTQALTVGANAFVNLRLSVGADINNNYNVLINSTSTSNIGSELNVQSSGLGGLSLSNRGVNDESIGFDSDYVPGTSLPIARGTSAAIIRKNSSTLTFEGRSSGIFLGSSYTPNVFATWDLGTGDLTTTGKITPGGDFQIGDNLIKFHDLTTNQTISSNSTYFGGPAIDIHSANGVSMETNGGQMVLTSAGNVGIGTTSPNIDGYSASAKVLTLSSAANSILELNTTAADASGNRPGEIAFEASVGQSGSADKRVASIISETEGTGANNRGGNLQFSTKGNNSSVFERMRITSAGLVGIGTTSPTALLGLQGAIGVSSNQLYLASGGNVGIGTVGPTSALQVTADHANEGSDHASQIMATGATDPNMRLMLGYDTTDNNGYIQSFQHHTGATTLAFQPQGGGVGIATTSAPSTLTVTGSACFSQGAGVGTVLCGNTAGNIYYKTANTGNYDVAENYTTTDITVNAGDIVKLDTSASSYSVTKAQSGDQIFGVVSTNPGVVLGGADASMADATTTRPVALSGRVPVKVDGENGAIAIGDPITVSSVPGVGMKALGSEEQIGVALQAWNGAPTDEGTIQVFVSQKQRVDASQFTIAPNGNIGIGSTSPMYKLSVAGDVAAISFVNISTRTAKTDISYLNDTAKSSILDTINGMNIATYRYKTEDPNDPLRLGLIAEEAPKQVLAVGGKGVDIYKLATFTLAGVQMQQKQINSLQIAQASTTAGMTTLSSGLSDTVLTVSSTTKAFADAQVTIFDLVGLTKEQGDAIAAVQTRLDTLAAQVGALGTTTASLQASLATLQTEVAALQAGQSGTSSTATTSVATSATAAELASSTPFIQSVASAVQSSIAAVGEWTVSKLSASIVYADRVEAKTVAVTQGFDITDQATGTVWCVTIKNGDWTKVPWSCETPSQNVAAAAGTQGATYTEPITQSSTLNVTQTDIAAPSASTTTTSVATTTSTTTSTATTTASVTDTTATTTASTATSTPTTTDSTSTATSSPSVTTTDTSGSTATSTTTTSTATTTASVTDTTATTTTSTATTTTP